MDLFDFFHPSVKNGERANLRPRVSPCFPLHTGVFVSSCAEFVMNGPVSALVRPVEYCKDAFHDDFSHEW